MLLYPAELLTVAYGVALLAAALVNRSLRGAGAALLLASVPAVAAVAAPEVARQWLPLLYIAAGYWVPALLVRRGPDARFTRWLQHADSGIFPTVRLPAWALHAADACYLLCYPLVPIGYAVVLLAGDAPARQRFWLAVLSAGFACYATLPWLRSLPPRRLGSDPNAARPVGEVNVAVLARVSHGLNTFPSGHAAVSTAATLALVSVPAAALACGVITAGVAIGAVAGRHHYSIDVVLGILVGSLSTVIANAIV